MVVAGRPLAQRHRQPRQSPQSPNGMVVRLPGLVCGLVMVRRWRNSTWAKQGVDAFNSEYVQLASGGAASPEPAHQQTNSCEF